MTDAELEFKREELRVKYQFKERVALALIAALATFSTGLLNWYTVTHSTEDVKQVAASKAVEIKQELKAAKAETDQGQAAIQAGVEASVKSWKAYQTRDPTDMDVANEAVTKAEALTEQPAARPQQP